MNGYVVTDEAGAAEITGGTAAAAAGAAISAINIPSPPVVEVPNVPVDVPAALASVPADPATVDDALTTGAGAGGLEGHAAAWDGVAAQLRTIGGEFRTLGSSLPASWAGPAGDRLSQRLLGFGDWMHASGKRPARMHPMFANWAGFIVMRSARIRARCRCARPSRRC
ncbi:PPE family protein [Mycobacterium xenopi 4042]|uniref:PPE family protein n=1 Tax=Mycobacterium xenopi 4042 TaxID=1299334 RepID=X7YS91_MYCXE|nr:PPE family protein [Mycobacterium xenopi 4042]